MKIYSIEGQGHGWCYGSRSSWVIGQSHIVVQKTEVRIRQASQFRIFKTHGVPSEVGLISCAKMKWIRSVLWEMQSGHDSVNTASLQCLIKPSLDFVKLIIGFRTRLSRDFMRSAILNDIMCSKNLQKCLKVTNRTYLTYQCFLLCMQHQLKLILSSCISNGIWINLKWHIYKAKDSMISANK